MASDAAFFEVLEVDLRALSAEARKTDSLATQITGWLQHTDFPQIKESAERAVLKLRAISHEGRGVEAVRTQEILRPFLLVCESKNPRLIGTVLGSIQKLLAHDAVSEEGRSQIIQALQQVEKSSDDTVKLKILQTALTFLQNAHNVDDKDGAGQVLSICFRLYSQNRGAPKVVSTAAATIRQAVALLFDHTVAEQQAGPGGMAPPEGLASGREMAAMLLLQDLMNMCAGHTPTWLKCPMVGRAFVLDLLEFVLLHRPAAFQTHSAFKVLLQSKLAPCLASLSQTALDPEVEPAATGEAKLLLRCLGALLRKHALLLPEMSLTLIELLLAGCSSSRMPWQRLLCLQVLRSLLADHQLLYVLFTSYDMSIHHDMNAVHDTISVAVEAIKGFMKAAEASEEDLVGSLSAIYSNRAVGKELQMDVDAHGPAQVAMQEVWTAYLAIELLLATVASIELLTDAVTSTSTAAADPLLLAPLTQSTTGSEGMHSTLSSSNSLVGLVRGNSAQGTGTPRSQSVSALFALGASRPSPNSSPRSSTTSLPSLPAAGEASAGVVAAPGASPGPAAGAAEGSQSPGNQATFGLRTRASAAASVPVLGVAASSSRPARTQSIALSAPVPAAHHTGVAPLSAATASTVVDVLWRPVLSGLSCALAHCRSRSSHESLLLVLLRGFQSYIFSAGALGEGPARDDFLKVLCEAAVVPAGSEESSGSGSGSGVESTAALRVSTASGGMLVDADMTVLTASGSASAAGPGAAGMPAQGPLTLPGIGLKNIHCLRTVFNVAHRLADSLGSSWGLVVEVLYTLDKALPGFGTGAAGKVPDAVYEPGTLSNELLILATAANQLFQSTQHMSADAQASLMSALAQVSSRALASGAGSSTFMAGATAPPGAQSVGVSTGAAVGQLRLPALNRMVEVLLYNLNHIQNLWPIFLTHLMEVLHSGNAAIRAAGLEALDKCLTGAIAAPDLGQQQQQPAQPALGAPGTMRRQQQQQQQPDAAGGPKEGYAADVEHMLLVALEGMYKEEREPDVRLGLLRVAMHVLQRHGEALSRGWVPLLRLLEAVPSWEDGGTISASYQCVESVCSDFLPSMPKIYMSKALEVAQLFAAQKSAINISLSAVGLLWNATDLLGRSRAAAAAAAAAAATAAAAAAEAPSQGPLQSSGSSMGSALGGLFSVLSLSRRTTAEDPASKAATAAGSSSPVPGKPDAPAAALSNGSMRRAASPLGSKPIATSSSAAGADADGAVEAAAAGADAAGGAASGADPHLAGRSDLSEEECTELLIRVFDHLRAIGMDTRPEVRNSGIRTLFLAVGSQAGKFSLPTWRHCLWEILFPLVQYTHFMADMSSSEEAAPAQLGETKGGKAVMMLVHHSRNTEQKQWDETTVLAFNGLTKVLRANMTTVLALPGFNDKWDETCRIGSQSLVSGRKSVAVAAAQMLTGFLQGYKVPRAGQPAAAAGTGTSNASSAPASASAAAAAGGGVVPAAGPAWKRTLVAIDEAVTVMAMPNTRVPLQARTELLGGLSAAYAAQGPESVFDLQDMQLLLRWMDSLARNPKGTDDVKTAVPGVLPPVQKLALQLLGQLNIAWLPEAWADVLQTLAGFLCPFRALMQRQQQEALAAAAAAAAATAPAGGGSAEQQQGSLRTPRAAGVPGTPQGLQAGRSFNRLLSARPGGAVPAAPAAATDAAQLTSEWMGKVIQRLVELYGQAPWQVRATLFGAVVQGLAECAALRYITRDDPVWQQAAHGLVSVVQAGLPAVNIMFVNHAQQPDNAWQVLADAFETFLLGEGLPEAWLASAQQQQKDCQERQAPQQQQQQQRVLQHSGSEAAAADAAGSSFRQPAVHSSSSSSSVGASNATGAGDAVGVAEASLQRVVLDTLTEVVLTSCSSAAHEQRSRLVRVLVEGAGSSIGHGCCSSSRSKASDLQQPTATAAAPASTGDTTAAGAAAVAAAAATKCMPADQRFSHMCLRRLALLAGRGTEGQPGSMNAVLLEVAQIALPQLLQRCRTVLQGYAAVEAAAAAQELQQLQQAVASTQQQQQQQQREGSQGLSQAERLVASILQQQQQQDLSSQNSLGQLQQQCVVEEVLCVLQVLLDLQLDAAVFEHLVEQEPSLAACLAAVQHAELIQQECQQALGSIRQQQQQGQQQQQPLSPIQQQQQQGFAQQQPELQSPSAAAASAAVTGQSSARSSQGTAEGAAGGDANSSRYQGHLVLLHQELSQCAACRDWRVRVLVQAALQAVGRQLGL